VDYLVLYPRRYNYIVPSVRTRYNIYSMAVPLAAERELSAYFMVLLAWLTSDPADADSMLL
jgi:hypothetical protein